MSSAILPCPPSLLLGLSSTLSLPTCPPPAIRMVIQTLELLSGISLSCLAISEALHKNYAVLLVVVCILAFFALGWVVMRSSSPPSRDLRAGASGRSGSVRSMSVRLGGGDEGQGEQKKLWHGHAYEKRERGGVKVQRDEKGNVIWNEVVWGCEGDFGRGRGGSARLDGLRYDVICPFTVVAS